MRLYLPRRDSGRRVTVRFRLSRLMATSRGFGAPMHNAPSSLELPGPRDCFGPKA